MSHYKQPNTALSFNESIGFKVKNRMEIHMVNWLREFCKDFTGTLEELRAAAVKEQERYAAQHKNHGRITITPIQVFSYWWDTQAPRSWQFCLYVPGRKCPAVSIENRAFKTPH